MLIDFRKSVVFLLSSNIFVWLLWRLRPIFFPVDIFFFPAPVAINNEGLEINEFTCFYLLSEFISFVFLLCILLYDLFLFLMLMLVLPVTQLLLCGETVLWSAHCVLELGCFFFPRKLLRFLSLDVLLDSEAHTVI